MTANASFRQKLVRFAETMAVAIAGGATLNFAHFPAGWMAGSMIFVATAALCGREIYMPTLLARTCFIALGIIIGGVATPATVHGMATWPASIAFISVAMLAITLAGTAYFCVVHGWDRQTALFAAVPGALSQVAVMAAERESDLRAIVIVQTVRVVVLAIGVPIGLAVSGVAGPTRLPVATLDLAAAPLQFVGLVAGCIVAALGLYRVGFTGGFFFGPMVVSAVLHGAGMVETNLPAWCASLAMVGLGAINGSRFNDTPFRVLLHYLAASLGALVVVSTVAAVFVGAASLLLSLRSADLIASYAPGSVDVMMILALALHLDPVFVGAHHLARIVVVSLVLPIGVRVTERQMPHASKLPAPLESARDTLED